MDSWIPALSTALQHSIQNVIFLSFQIWISGNTWPQCTVKFTSLLFSLLCKNLRVLVFLSRQRTKWMRILKYKDKRMAAQMKRKCQCFWCRWRRRRLVSLPIRVDLRSRPREVNLATKRKLPGGAATVTVGQNSRVRVRHSFPGYLKYTRR